MPEPEWTVAGVLSGLGLLWGEAGVGKSFLACSIAAAVATGRPWLGHRVTEGPVVYVAGEGGLVTVANRLDAAIGALHCCDPDEPPPPVWVVTPGVDLVRGPGELQALIANEGVCPQLIIVDTLSRCFTGDENKQEDMGKFVRSLDLLRDTWGGSVLVIHHANRAGEVRGSSVLYGAVDVSLRMRAVGDEWQLVADKLRDRDVSGPAAEFRFEQRECEGVDELGDQLTTRVVQTSAGFEAMVPEVALAMTGRGEWTYGEWRAACGQHAKGTFDRLVTSIVGDADTWGIVHEESEGKYKWQRRA